MTTHTLILELRYFGLNSPEDDMPYKNLWLFLGVFDNLEQAMEEGNRIHETFKGVIEKTAEESFTMKGLYGVSTTLLTNVCSGDPITYFLKIGTYPDITPIELIKEVKVECDRYLKWKNKQES